MVSLHHLMAVSRAVCNTSDVSGPKRHVALIPLVTFRAGLQVFSIVVLIGVDISCALCADSSLQEVDAIGFRLLEKFFI